MSDQSQPEYAAPEIPQNPNPVTEGFEVPVQQPVQYRQFYVDKPSEVIEGERYAKTSTILGIVGMGTGLGIILGPMAIIKAARAEKLGVDSTVGKVTGWLGTIFGAFAIIGLILWIGVFGALLANANPDDIKTGGFTNNQPWYENQDPLVGPTADQGIAKGEKSNFDKIYDKLTPAEKAEMDIALSQLEAEVSSR
jgi:hypothetical protein